LRRIVSWTTLSLTLAWTAAGVGSSGERRNNLVLFVADGLRGGMVDAHTAPNMTALGQRGVSFPNSHSVMPPFTMANASAMATGHYLGDTGVFSNTIYVAFPVLAAAGNVTPFLENDAVLKALDEHFGGDALNETTLLKAAHDIGFSTAAVGKLGPALLFDHTDREPLRTILIDDSTGNPNGHPVPSDVLEAMKNAGLPVASPSRGANGQAGSVTSPGTRSANIEQESYFADVATKVILPRFKKRS